jgi:UDP:flavonoid glycosyltransferase YjiC (YdhE family)
VKVLFVAISAHGHINPMLPLADSLARAGHTVSFATGADMRAYITQRGHQAVAVGVTDVEQRALVAQTRPPDLPKRDAMTYALGTLFTRLLAPRMLPELLALIDLGQPDLIVYESSAFAAPLAGAMRDVPTVHHSYGVLRPLDAQQLATDSMAPLWSEYGRAMPDHAGMFNNAYLDVCPLRLQLPHVSQLMVRRPLRSAGVPVSAERHDDRRTVLVTFGTVFHRDCALVAGIARDVARLPVDVLVTAGPGVSTTAFDPQPNNVTVVDYVPLPDVLPRCGAVVTHGGAGTMLAALGHGVPLLVVPQGADQFVNADRVAAAGAGMVNETGENLSEDVRRILQQPQYITAAQQIAEEIASMPSAASVASALVRDFSPSAR